jgi:hypothetical protein
MHYPAKLSLNIDGAIKIFHKNQKLKQYMTTKPPLQETLQGILYTEDESKQNHTGQEASNHRRRKESNQRVTLIQVYTIKS